VPAQAVGAVKNEGFVAAVTKPVLMIRSALNMNQLQRYVAETHSASDNVRLWAIFRFIGEDRPGSSARMIGKPGVRDRWSATA
jgi:hypothetical protein